MEECILIGRFQPFTRGHLAAYKWLCERYDRVHIGVSRRLVEKQDSKDFLCAFDRSRLIYHALRGHRKEGTAVSQVCGYNRELMPNPEWVIAVGEDQRKAMEKMKEYDPEHRYVIVPRSEADISATRVRSALLEDDRDLFKTMMPEELWEHYAPMRKILLEHYEEEHRTNTERE